MVEQRTSAHSAIYTDESGAYNRVRESGRLHKTVCHSAREFARDEDGDGFHEVHCNSTEGLWTGLRNFLRPFRGVNKRYLEQYTAVFEAAYNFRMLTLSVIRAMTIPDFFLEIHASP